MKKYISPETSIVRIHVGEDITEGNTEVINYSKSGTPDYGFEAGAKSVDFDEEDEMDGQDVKWE